jgi:hypothetical protein
VVVETEIMKTHPFTGFFFELVFTDDKQIVALVQEEAVGILAALLEDGGLGFRVADGTTVVVMPFQAGLSALPHSRQHVSQRGVMSPQNGHTRCDAKSPSCASILSIFLSEAAMKASRLRTRTRSACMTVSIVDSGFLNLTRSR